MKQYLSSLFIVVAALVLLAACSKDELRTSPGPEPIDPTVVSILPVVFHVFYADENDATQKVPANRLRQVLNNVNELYSGTYSGAESGSMLLVWNMSSLERTSIPSILTC